MKTQDVEHAQASLLEVSQHKYVPEKAKRLIQSYLQLSAPEADAYEFQSEVVINMFDDLEHKMADERSDGQKTEMSEKHAYDMLMADMTNRLDRTKSQRSKDIALKAKKEQALADAKGEKADTEQTLAEDEKYLKELRQMCTTKTQEYEARQELRQGEQEAVGKAIEILSG